MADMRLFSEGVRTDVRPSFGRESTYDFLERSAWPATTALRDLLEEWYDDYQLLGNEDGQDLRQRFSSNDSIQHVGAGFELYLHGLFRTLGYYIERNPPSSERRTVRDFKLSKGTVCFYLEGTTIYSAAAKRHATHGRIEADVRAYLNQIQQRNFWVSFRVDGEFLKTPKKSEIRDEIIGWLDNLSWEEVDTANRLGVNVGYTIEGDTWSIHLDAIAKTDESRDDRLIGIHSHVCFDGIGESIRAGLKEKVTKYGVPDLPYVVALNLVSSMGNAFKNEGQEMERLLYGAERCSAFWQKGRNTRLSGVLVVHNFLVWQSATETPVLYLNPFAAKPIDFGAAPFDVVRCSKNEVSRTKAEVGIHEILKVPEHWPFVLGRGQAFDG